MKAFFLLTFFLFFQAGAAKPQELRRDVVYDTLSFEQLRAILQDMGQSATLIDFQDKNEEHPDQAIRIDAGFRVLLTPMKCSKKLCTRLNMLVLFSDKEGHFAVDKVNSASQAVAISVSRVGDNVIFHYALTVDGGATSDHIKRQVNFFIEQVCVGLNRFRG